MKKIILIILIIFSISCEEPILKVAEYAVIDTLHVSKSGSGRIHGYDVIIQVNYDSTYHYGYISNNSNLILFNPRPIKLNTK